MLGNLNLLYVSSHKWVKLCVWVVWKLAAWGSYQKMIRIKVSFKPVWKWHLVIEKQLYHDLTPFPASAINPRCRSFIVVNWPYMTRIAQGSSQYLCYSPCTVTKVKRPCIWLSREDKVGRDTIETWVTPSCCLGFIIIIWMPGLVLARRLPLSLSDAIKKKLAYFSFILFIFSSWVCFFRVFIFCVIMHRTNVASLIGNSFQRGYFFFCALLFC